MTLNFCHTLDICEMDVVTAKFVYAFKIGDEVTGKASICI